MRIVASRKTFMWKFVSCTPQNFSSLINFGVTWIYIIHNAIMTYIAKKSIDHQSTHLFTFHSHVEIVNGTSFSLCTLMCSLGWGCSLFHSHLVLFYFGTMKSISRSTKSAWQKCKFSMGNLRQIEFISGYDWLKISNLGESVT